MDLRRHSRNLLLPVVLLWAGCVQVPLKAPPVEQSEWGVPAVAGLGLTPGESSSRGSRPLADEKIGQAGVNRPG